MKTQLDLYRPRDSWRRVCCREAHPVKDEMSVATPKTHAREPIQLDIIVVCRKRMMVAAPAPSRDEAISAARCKIERMHAAGFNLSRNDQKIILFGQLLTTVRFDRRRPRVFRCSTRLCSYRIFAIHRDAPTFFVRIKQKHCASISLALFVFLNMRFLAPAVVTETATSPNFHEALQSPPWPHPHRTLSQSLAPEVPR